MQIYGLKNCDTCRKALKSLPQAQLLDVRVDGVPTEVMQAAFAQFDEALLNTRGLSEGERGSAPLDLIAQHPALMKRPLIVDGGQMFLGWTKDVQAVLLGA